MDALDALLPIALDLTGALTAQNRYQRLLEAVRRVVPCDAAALLRLEGNELVSLAIHGLRADVLGRRFRLDEHPRLERICRDDEPVRFAPDSPLPDPFDGMLLTDPTATARVHACLGCPLRVEGELVGALTADACAPGAFDMLDKRVLSALGALAGAAVRTSDLVTAIERAAMQQGTIARDLMKVAAERGGRLLGMSRAMDHVRHEIAVVAPSDFPVLVSGETGVGKEVVVRAIHAASPRKDAPIAYVNCAALPESLAEAELFGHVRGAFTGAAGDRGGKFDVADGGTLFLDEVGELPLSIQPKLLRAVQHGEVQRVGADRSLHVNVRVLAATNRDLTEAVRSGAFRADLFHRLNVYPLHVPPLRERREDIALLTGHFCDDVRAKLRTGLVRLHPNVLAALVAYDWPGNVRELENVVSRLVLRAASHPGREESVLVGPEWLGPEFLTEPSNSTSTPIEQANEKYHPALVQAATESTLKEALDNYQRDFISRRVKQCNGNWAKAARALGVDRSNLFHLAKRLGILPAKP